jgi:hypothetical protein
MISFRYTVRNMSCGAYTVSTGDKRSADPFWRAFFISSIAGVITDVL